MAQTPHLDIDAALKAEQERLTTRKTELDTELSEITSRLARINRYFTDEPQQRQLPLAPRKPAGDRAPRGSVQITVLETIQANPTGLTVSQLKDKLPNVGQQSISNALSTLWKANKIVSQGRGKPYLPAPT